MPRFEPANPKTGTLAQADGCADVGETAVFRLRRSPYLPLREVHCECGGGVLRLWGSLPSYYLKQLAQETVKGLEGVGEIINQIEVLARPCGQSARLESVY